MGGGFVIAVVFATNSQAFTPRDLFYSFARETGKGTLTLCIGIAITLTKSKREVCQRTSVITLQKKSGFCGTVGTIVCAPIAVVCCAS